MEAGGETIDLTKPPHQHVRRLGGGRERQPGARGIGKPAAADGASVLERQTSAGARADWVKFVQGLRDAGMSAYKAAQSKNQDAIVEATGNLADACSACHEVYREKPGGTRCVP